MRVAITGGAGFLGARLARALLDDAAATADGTTVRLLDRVAPPGDLLADTRVEALVGDLAQQLGRDPFVDVDVVVHLAAAVSGECERDFDLGLANNLDLSRAVFESCRRRADPLRLVFASSVAVFGATSQHRLPAVVTDDTLPIPQSSYGTQKFMTEQLLSDYTRRGYVRGRSVRLMTVTVRPGRPNAAASSFVSGIIREPLNGDRAVCPVGPATEIAVSSPAMAVTGLMSAITAADESWGSSVAMNLPALTVTPREMLAAMDRVTGEPTSELVDWIVDPAVVGVVATWPARFRTERAAALGLRVDSDFASIVRAHLGGG